MFRSYDDMAASSLWDVGRRLVGITGSDDFNACERVLDRHAAERPDRVAVVFADHEGRRREVTFARLTEQATRFASVLDRAGVGKGARVLTVLEPCEELYAALLGSVRAGVIAGPLFSGFGSSAIGDRLGDCGATLLVTAAHHLHKIRPLYASLPELATVLVVGGDGHALVERERSWEQAMAEASPRRPPEPTSSQDPLVIHYTSGTTGRPKGAIHVHEALVGHVGTARVVLDLRPDDVYWCTADPGWVTGTSYGVFAPLALGVRSVVFRGGFAADSWYRTIQEERISVWYTSPTALRMLMREGVECVRRWDLSSLRHVCSVGEPLNPAVISWGREAFGRTIHDTWWQTETGCQQIVNVPFLEVRPGSMGKPLGGVTAAVLDPATYAPVPDGSEGLLALRAPWPSMFRTYWRRPELYESRFKQGWYVTGDRARRDADGYYWFVARDDDVINTSGHLVGPFEIESALLAQGAVAEAAAFGVPDEAAGERVVVEVVLKAGIAATKELERDLRTAVRRAVGPHAVPRELAVVPRLPRTRSGKIMRRVARAEHLGLPSGDVSALED